MLSLPSAGRGWRHRSLPSTLATVPLLRGGRHIGTHSIRWRACRGAIGEMERGVLEGTEAWLGKVLSMLPVRSISVGRSPRHGV
jgi:hypothetical protein